MIYLIFFFAMLVQSVSGFGAGLLAVPLLTLVYEPRYIIPAFAVTVWILNIGIAIDARKDIVWPRVARIAFGSWLGLPAGIYMLGYADQDLIRLFIAVLTLVLGICFLFGLKPRFRDTQATSMLVGGLSGFLAGIVAMGGPPLIVMGYAMGWPKNEFRSTLLTCFAINGMLSLLLYLTGGLLHPGNLKIIPVALVPAFLASFLGVRIKNHLNETIFSRIVLFLIIMIGLTGVFRFFL